MDIVAKFLLCGDGLVGKTSIRRKYLGATVSSNYLMTIGADLSITTINLSLDDTAYKLKTHILDIAGQPNFKLVRGSYYKGSNAAFLVYDITDRQSFVNIEQWVNEIKLNNPMFPIPMVLVANKIDLKKSSDPSIVTDIEGQELAKILSHTYYKGNWDVPYIETSAITGEKIHDAFHLLAKFLVREMLAQEKQV